MGGHRQVSSTATPRRGVTQYDPNEDPYYMAQGHKMAMAYNEYTFVPMTNTTQSVLFTSPSQDPGKPNEPSGGGPTTIALGKRLAIHV